MDSCHVVVFPFIGYGHMIPLADIAVLLASRGLRTTIVTTPSSAHRLTHLINKTISYTHPLALHLIEFQTVVPPGIDDPDKPFTTDLITGLLKAVSTLQDPFEQFIQESRPNCIVADVFYPWTTKIAAKFNIPRIVFNAAGYFAMCASEEMGLYQPKVSSDSEAFVIPNLPREIKLTKKQLPHNLGEEFDIFMRHAMEAEEAVATSYGVISNTFYELEPEYVHHYHEVIKRRSWHIGPVSLYSKSLEDKVVRGKKATIDEHECLKWLDSKPPNSVIYVCFGTLAKVTKSQVFEIAMALEACEVNFIWVVRKYQETMIPEGFEERMEAKGKGLIIKGWSPQVLILEHESVGGFISQCGWNAVLEGVCGGVAMVTWPVIAEQFYNAKVVTDVLQIGVPVGDVEWTADCTCEGTKREAIQSAVTRVMGAEEGDKMRERARELKEKAKTAVAEGGSSYLDLSKFIEDIKAFKFEI